ncbi:MAG: hypothetical protein WD135_06355 [Ferruginibacter sp.]
MSTHNPGNFFLPHDFEEEDSNNPWNPTQIQGKVLYQKSIDIINITQTIIDLIPDEDAEDVTKALMNQNVMTVAVKIIGSINSEPLYTLLMEAAVIIKVNICELKAQLWVCEEIHNIDAVYTNVLRDEIENFRRLFVEWVQIFDKKNDCPDEWHLFNDPNSIS